MPLDRMKEALKELEKSLQRSPWEDYTDAPVGQSIPGQSNLSENLDLMESVLIAFGKPSARGLFGKVTTDLHAVEARINKNILELDDLQSEQLKALVDRLRILVKAADDVGRFAAMTLNRSVLPMLLDLVANACNELGVDEDLKASLLALADEFDGMQETWMAASLRKSAMPNEEMAAADPEVAILVDSYLHEEPTNGTGASAKTKVQDLPSGKKILALPPQRQVAALRETWRAIDRIAPKVPGNPRGEVAYNDASPELRVAWTRARALRDRLIRRNLPLSEREMAELIIRWPHTSLAAAEKYIDAHGLGIHLRAALEEAPRVSQIFDSPETGKPLTRIRRMLARPEEGLVIAGESPLKDALTQWLAAQEGAQKTAWDNFFRHALATEGKQQPVGDWLSEAEGIVDDIGEDKVLEQLKSWAVEPGLSKTAREPAGDILKAMVWLADHRKDEGLANFFGSLCETAYRKVPGIGPGAIPLGNACINALGSLSGQRAVAELVRLKSRVKFSQGRKKLDEVLEAAAERAGLDVTDLEELALPTFGLDEEGGRTEVLGDVTAEISITDSDEVTLSWIGADGKPRKSVPASVKAEYAQKLKELRAEIKEIKGLLSGHRWLLEKHYLTERSLPLADWRARYLEHPLLAKSARRLIWNFDNVAAVPAMDQFVDANGDPVEPAAGATVSLWHPIQAGAGEVLAWRKKLSELEIIQPFKQAHREVYLLTDAERDTRGYSNRFAAHFLYQSQMNALMRARDWTHRAIGWDQDQFMPRLILPNGRGSAIFGLGRVDAGVSESGADLYVASQRVQFEDESGALVDLEKVPPLALSEVMRDVDLFVGVASVGNNPEWQDGGPEGRFYDYWRRYNSAELAEMARIRRAVLADLLPRLKIAGVCDLEERFLKVRGTKRSYRIHIGSGNILMEPGNEYLCIVPKQVKAAGDGENVRLPFEGDGVLSIILSKAFLLAADDKITDKSILSQIGR